MGWIFIPRSVWQRDTHAELGPSRPLALLAILLAHGVVLGLLSQQHYARTGGAADEVFTLLFLPLSGEDDRYPQSVQPGAQPSAPPRVPSTPRPANHLRGSGASDTDTNNLSHQTVTPTPGSDQPAEGVTPHVDWQAEAADAAVDTLRSRERTARQAHALDHPPGMDAGHEVLHGPLIWDRSRTNRLEIEPGLILFHFNDRCAALLLPIPFAFCQVGKITPNGHLFQNMRQYLDDRDTQPLP